MKKNPFTTIGWKQIRNVSYFLLVFLLSWNCNLPSENDNFNRENEKRVLFQYLLLSPTNPVESCATSLQAAQTCLNKTPDLPTPLSEAAIITLFSNGNTSLGTYQDFCTVLLNSSTFSKFTNRAKTCVMNCNRSYWLNKDSAGTCGESGLSQISGLSTGTFSCTKTCVSISGE
ncbi:hypothetical protein LEP1GSC039_1024 [Leptospira santarosai str. 2000027870]|uniref:hypothetical protein n=1 Tax=Leptospira santarosai TaxID=28183 RepID=UPI0002BFF3B5|nr:hypothetical protein [Leptospira santarosai]EMM87036.1 hypothetical protein LEP1GSC039_1024 [Leptospira santarosai str. 2000027870]